MGGRLRDGSTAHWPALVLETQWEVVRQRRAVRATNTGRLADPRRPYALDMLHCAACGARLTGDTGRMKGHAYRMELYEQIVDELLTLAAVAAPTIASVVSQVAAQSTSGRTDATSAFGAERDRALARYRWDRDAAGLERTMSELDRREGRLSEQEECADVPPEVAAAYLIELSDTWRKAQGGRGRRLLAAALFDRIEVLGLRETTVHVSAEAARHGLAAVLPAELVLSVSGRGERRQTSATDLNVPACLLLEIEVTGTEAWIGGSVG